MRIFDAHAHVSAWPVHAIDAMRELGVSDLCNISYPRDGGSEEALSICERELFSAPDVQDLHIYSVASLPFEMVERSPDDFVAASISKIDALKDDPNFVGLKIWKDVGMARRGPDGEPLTIDNSLLETIFAAVAEARLVCVVHTGDPLIAWKPEARKSEYYRRNPEYVMSEQTGFPCFQELMERFEHVVSTWRQITFVGAHFASLDHDFHELAGLLRRNPNLLVDSAGRHEAIVRGSGGDFRRLFGAYPDRIIYGSDWTIDRSCTEAEIAHSRNRRQVRLQQVIDVLSEAELTARFFWRNARRTFVRHNED